MILKKIQIESFGKLKDFTLEPKAGLNHYCYPNEFGKTTLMTFIYFILYGYDSKEMKRYFPWDGAPLSGSMIFSLGEEKWQIYRHHPQKGAERQQVMELSTGKELVLAAKEKPGPRLLGLDGETFKKTFFVGQEELSFGRTDGLDTALKNLAATGDENASFDAANAYLRKEHTRYMHYGKNQGRLLELRAESLKNAEELSELERRIEEKIAEKQQMEALEQQKAEQEAQLSAIEARLQQAKKNDAARRLEALLKLEQRAAEKPRSEAEDALLLEQEQAFLRQEEAERAYHGQREEIAHLQREQQSEQQRLEAFYLPADTGERLAAFEEGKKGAAAFGIILIVLGILAAAGGFLISPLWIGAAVLLMSGLFLCLREPMAKRQFCRHCGVADLRALRERWDQYLGAKERLSAIEAVLTQAKEAEEELAKKAEECRAALQAIILQTRLLTREELKEEQFIRAVHRQTAENMEQQKAQLLEGRSLEEWQREAVGGNGEGESYQQVFAEKQQLLSELTRLMDALSEKDLHQLSALWKRAEELRGKLSADRTTEQEWERALRAVQSAMGWLEAANEDMTRHFAPRLCKDAGRLLSLLTDGAYSAVQMDDRYNIRLETAKGAYPVDAFSKGTKDAVYFAFRLAVGGLISGIPLPLMLDDPFVNLDDCRLLQAEGLLKRAAEDRQILYFTCRK